MKNIKSFSGVWARAATRKGGEEALRAALSDPIANDALALLPDAHFLSIMCRCIFQAGFVWKVVEYKWAGFEEAFSGFDPEILSTLSDKEWEAFASDKRIIRNPQKIRAVRGNLWFLMDTVMAHGSFGRFLADWAEEDLVGLFRLLKRDGKRLGGATGQYFLRFSGKDTFIFTGDVITCLQRQGLEIADRPVSQRDLQAIQAAFNYWHAETGLPYQQLSMVMSRSVGENSM